MISKRMAFFGMVRKRINLITYRMAEKNGNWYNRNTKTEAGCQIHILVCIADEHIDGLMRMRTGRGGNMQKIKSRVAEENGISVIRIDDKNYAPVSFKTFRPTERNITDFYAAGIRLFNILSTGMTSALGVPYSFYGESWLDDEKYDFSVIDRQIDFFIEHAPEGYFMLMLCLDTREWWLKKYPDSPNSFLNLAQMEADPYWREMAAKYLQAVLTHVEEKYGDKVYGYFLMAGTTTEWLSEESHEESSASISAAYRKWKHDEKAVVPEKERLEAPSRQVFLDFKKERDIIDYRKFVGWQRADTILYFAAKAQEILKHEKVIGIYYGYILELWGSRLYEAGHLGYEAVFQSDDIDIIAEPFSYGHRGQRCGSQQMVTNATLSLHRKLCFLEHDQTTCIVPDYVEGMYFVHQHKAKTLEEDVNLLRRDFMYAITNNCAIWWFDMFEGWFYDKRLMGEIGNMISIYNHVLEQGLKSVSEIAFVVDPESLLYVNKYSWISSDIIAQRHGLCFMGAPYDIYSSCDIGRIDKEKYKLIIFADQFKKDVAVEQFVAAAKKAGKTLVFLYAYNVVDEEYRCLDMCDSLGIHVEENPKKEKRMLFDNGCIVECCAEQTCFAVADDTAEVWARYENSAKPAMAVRKEDRATIIYAGFANLSGSVLQKILSLAGVHRYLSGEDAVVYVNDRMLGIYHCNEDDVTVTLCEEAEYVDVFNGNKKYISKDKMIVIPYENVRAKLLLRTASENDL